MRRALAPAVLVALTAVADQITDIKVVMTMVGGRLVYDAAAATGTR